MDKPVVSRKTQALVDRLIKQAMKDKDIELLAISYALRGALTSNTLKTALRHILTEFAVMVVQSVEEPDPEPVPFVANAPWYCNVKRVD